jgi:hypothetical protein
MRESGGVEEREEEHSMAKHSKHTSTASVDWATLSVQAAFEGGQAFLKIIGQTTPGVTDAQLEADEQQMNRRYVRSLDYAKRDRSNPGPHFLSAVQNWSNKQAIVILREKVAGKPMRKDFYRPFQFDLTQQIAILISDIQLFWKQEDEQRDAAKQQQIAAKREEAERAFGEAYPIVRGLSDAVLNGERQRQVIFNDGQNVAQHWANSYENSVKKREDNLAVREQRIQDQEHENRAHQLALRSLAKWDDRNSVANTIVNTGKNAIGCLLLWLLIVAGVLIAIYFAFPHH